MAEPVAPAPGGSWGAVVLAAGGSLRMGGRPKQLLEVGGVPLLSRVVDEALQSGAGPVVVVLGAGEERILESIAGRNVIVARNPDWSAGLSTSIRVGLDALLKRAPHLDAVLLTPCDQPALSSAIFSSLAAMHFSTGRTACSRFNGRNASPAVFGREHFQQLQNLIGDQGARELLNAAPGTVEAIETPALDIDFDTEADYNAWTKSLPGDGQPGHQGQRPTA